MYGAVGIYSPPLPPCNNVGGMQEVSRKRKNSFFPPHCMMGKEVRNVTRLPKRYINIVIGGGGGHQGGGGVDAKNRYFREHRSHVVRAATL